MFIFILALTALVIAGVAAYFSVQGIATLYAGSFIAVLIMAGSLELGKLVSTSFLYRYWNKTNRLLKTYLLVSIFMLMSITSMGIFGFLTSAYQTSLAEYSTSQTQQTFLNSQKETLQKELDSLDLRIKTLNESRISQEKRLPSMSRASAKPIYEDIAKAGEEITQTRNRMTTIYEEMKKLDSENFEIQKQNNKQKDIGTLKYAAELFNTDVNQIVKLFTLGIIFVFDPLAICLVLAYNIAIGKTPEEVLTEEVTEELQTVINRTNKEVQGITSYRN